jgi:hypothetical protein
LRTALCDGKAEEVAEILCAIATGRRKGTGAQLLAIREIVDRTEGKPQQRLEVDATVNASIVERLQAARTRFGGRVQPVNGSSV